MKKILIVQYDPKKDSKTSILTQKFYELVNERFEVIRVFLDENHPPFYNTNSLMSYTKRNFKKEQLNSQEEKYLEEFDKLALQLEETDVLVLSYPIYNFSMPAAIKAWIDSVVQAGRSFRYTEFGPEGFYKNKKAIVINSSDGTPQNSASDFSTPLIKRILNFIGITDITFLGVWAGKFKDKEKSIQEQVPLIESIASKL